MRSLGNRGTAQRCDDCARETLAVAYPEAGVLEIKDRRHGDRHVKTLPLQELVRMLDPGGTSFVPVRHGSAVGA